MKSLLPIVALVLPLLSGAADGPPKSKFTRPATSLQLVERSDSYEKGSFARWVGSLAITGKLVVEFDRPEPGGEQQDDVGVVFFQPSSDSLRKLPHAIGTYYPLQANVLWLGGTPKEVLTPLLGAKRVRLMIDSKPSRYEVPARLRLTEFYTSVECDHRAYEIKYVDLALLSQELVAIGEARNIGC